MRNLRSISRLVFAAVAVAFFASLAGCRKPLAKLRLGVCSASFGAPSSLYTALPIVNDGTGTAEDIEVSAVTISGTTLTLPTALPATIGSLAPDEDSTLAANFTGPEARPDTEFKVRVEGTYREHGHNFKFSLDQSLRSDPASPGSATSLTGSAPTLKVNGAPYPPQKPNFGSEVNEGGHGRRVPTGPERPLTPSNQSGVKPSPGTGGGSASISFPTNDPVGISSSTVAEPSGASGGGVVFETENWFASYSTNGGAAFTKLDPTTIFPNTTAGGFCCDQIVQYAPSIDRFIWLMQYGQAHLSTDPAGTSTGPNLYRIASASPADIKSSNGTSWSYFDVTSTALLGSGAGLWLDYPDASIGDSYYYFSSDDVVNGGHVVVRVPLSNIKTGGTINFGFTASSNGGVAYGGHLTQNTRDEVFWAGHNSNSSIRIFNWPESSNNYAWRDISIGSWPNTTSTNLMTSTTPDSQDWLNKLSGFPGNAVLGLARSAPGVRDRQGSNLLYFAWTGAIGNGFKQPQVQWIALDRNNNFSLVSQQQVWNPGYAYAYPAFAVNANNEIGMSLEWGGGGNYENHVAGFWGDYVVYETTNSTIGTKRFGDYVTIRQNTTDATKFDAFGYGLDKTSPPGGTKVDVHYIIFSR